MSEGDSESSVVHDWRPVMRQVIIRAICDALGYTNIPIERKAHADAVKEAQSWFLEEAQLEDLDAVCDIAGVDGEKIRSQAKLLIHAKFSNDYSRIPAFWQKVFAEGRHPNLTNIERALDHMKKIK